MFHIAGTEVAFPFRVTQGILCLASGDMFHKGWSIICAFESRLYACFGIHFGVAYSPDPGIGFNVLGQASSVHFRVSGVTFQHNR